jgi:hypothetical protein
MKKGLIFLIVVFILTLAAAAALIFIPAPEKPSTSVKASISDLIEVDAPVIDAKISSPLTISGKARGPWYFEASFPIVLTDWDGRIIAEGHAEAQSDWMTTEFVPFSATLTFTTPAAGDPAKNRGTLILKKDNPSGDPARDQALEIPVEFK